MNTFFLPQKQPTLMTKNELWKIRLICLLAVMSFTNSCSESDPECINPIWIQKVNTIEQLFVQDSLVNKISISDYEALVVRLKQGDTFYVRNKSEYHFSEIEFIQGVISCLRKECSAQKQHCDYLNLIETSMLDSDYDLLLFAEKLITRGSEESFANVFYRGLISLQLADVMVEYMMNRHSAEGPQFEQELEKIRNHHK